MPQILWSLAAAGRMHSRSLPTGSMPTLPTHPHRQKKTYIERVSEWAVGYSRSNHILSCKPPDGNNFEDNHGEQPLWINQSTDTFFATPLTCIVDAKFLGVALKTYAALYFCNIPTSSHTSNPSNQAYPSITLRVHGLGLDATDAAVMAPKRLLHTRWNWFYKNLANC